MLKEFIRQIYCGHQWTLTGRRHEWTSITEAVCPDLYPSKDTGPHLSILL